MSVQGAGGQAGKRASTHTVEDAQVRLPDEMGVHSDDGVVWLPRAFYPARSAARTWYAEFTGLRWIDVSVLARWMRFMPREWEERWIECERDEPGAFQVWRCEA